MAVRLPPAGFFQATVWSLVFHGVALALVIPLLAVGPARPPVPVLQVSLVPVLTRPAPAAVPPATSSPSADKPKHQARPRAIQTVRHGRMASVSTEAAHPPAQDRVEAPEPAQAVSSSVPVSPLPPTVPRAPAPAEMSAGPGPETPPLHGPAYFHNPAPAYPLAARRRGEEGTAVLRAQVQPDGRCHQVEVAVSSGHPLLDRAAMAAVRGWHFVPARRNGAAVAAWVDIPVVFKLRDGESSL